jgi:hypothetical protein
MSQAMAFLLFVISYQLPNWNNRGSPYFEPFIEDQFNLLGLLSLIGFTNDD